MPPLVPVGGFVWVIYSILNSNMFIFAVGIPFCCVGTIKVRYMLTIQSQLLDRFSYLLTDFVFDASVVQIIDMVAPLQIARQVVGLVLVLMVYLRQIVGIRHKGFGYKSVY